MWRSFPGELNPAAKLTRAQVADIRSRYEQGGIRQIDLAAEYGIAQSVVSAIVRGVAWKASGQ